jgi:hypothetical protein
MFIILLLLTTTGVLWQEFPEDAKSYRILPMARILN